MKKNYYYFLLASLNFISILFFFQIKLEILPLFTSHFNENQCRNINDLIINISIGLISSTIFYLIVVYYPEKQKKVSTLKIIQPRLNTIFNEINHSVHYLYTKRLKSNNGIYKLQPSDFESIKFMDSKLMDFKYQVLNEKKQWIPIDSGQQTEIQYFTHLRTTIISKIDEIFAIPTISCVDENLIEGLAKLRDCWFFSGINSYNNPGLRITVTDFNKGTYDYYRFFIESKKFGELDEFKVTANSVATGS